MNLQKLTLSPVPMFMGEVSPPGSKSIANRALALSALAKGQCHVFNLPDGEDVQLMLSALKNMGLSIQQEDDTLRIKGLGGPVQLEKDINLHLGNSGTASRFLTSLLCAGKGRYTLDGIPRLRERPINDLVEALEHWSPVGKTPMVRFLENPKALPICIDTEGISGGLTKVRGNLSSQFLSALLMTMPLTQKSSEIQIEGELVSRPYIDITLDVMKQFGVDVQEKNSNHFVLEKPFGYQNPDSYYIEPDASSASYFMAAAAIAGGQVTVRGIGSKSLQFKSEGRFALALKDMGAKVQIEENSITVAKAPLKGIRHNADKMSDTGMTLAIAACFAKGTSRIEGIYNWRLKETDRLKAMSTELKKIGANVVEGEDFIEITPPQRFLEAEIETYNDHRMAMCFSLVALGGVAVHILNPHCVSKTYPKYFEDFAALSQS